MYLSLHVFGVLSLALLAVLYRAASDSSSSLSPQGCRMSYMSPSYVLQPAFNSSWTPLAKRYSLILYREVGWEDNQVRSQHKHWFFVPALRNIQPHGLPVLFIPGNAGSSHQIRSIASSASRQFYTAPHSVSSELSSRGVKPLDFFAGASLDHPPATSFILMPMQSSIMKTSLLSTVLLSKPKLNTLPKPSPTSCPSTRLKPPSFLWVIRWAV